jgi:hypothetical protein
MHKYERDQPQFCTLVPFRSNNLSCIKTQRKRKFSVPLIIMKYKVHTFIFHSIPNNYDALTIKPCKGCPKVAVLAAFSVNRPAT